MDVKVSEQFEHRHRMWKEQELEGPEVIPEIAFKLDLDDTVRFKRLASDC